MFGDNIVETTSFSNYERLDYLIKIKNIMYDKVGARELGIELG